MESRRSSYLVRRRALVLNVRAYFWFLYLLTFGNIFGCERLEKVVLNFASVSAVFRYLLPNCHRDYLVEIIASRFEHSSDFAQGVSGDNGILE